MENACGSTITFNQLVGETIESIIVSGVNCVFIKTTSGKYFNIYTVGSMVYGISSMEVTETKSDYDTPIDCI